MPTPHLAYIELEPGKHEPTVTSGILASHADDAHGIRIITADPLSTSKVGFSAMTRLQGTMEHLASVRLDVRQLLTDAHGEHSLLIYDLAQDRYSRAVEKDVGAFFSRHSAGPMHNFVLVEVGKSTRALIDLLGSRDTNASAGEAAEIPDATARAHRRAAEWREKVSSAWLTSEQVAKSVGTRTSTNPGQYASKLRKDGRLLGARSISANVFKHPEFQFTADGRIRQGIRELLKVMTPPMKDPDGWNRALWLYAPHPQLGGRRPAQVYSEDPDQVLALAKDAFAENQDGKW